MLEISHDAVTGWARLIRLQRQALESVEARLKAAGFPPLAWYDVLLELDRAPDGLRQFEIGERILLNKHNLSRLLDRLSGQGLIRREACPEDGRGSVVQITSKGRRLRERMWPEYAAAIEAVFASRLSANEISVLGNTLGKLLD